MSSWMFLRAFTLPCITGGNRFTSTPEGDSFQHHNTAVVQQIDGRATYLFLCMYLFIYLFIFIKVFVAQTQGWVEVLILGLGFLPLPPLLTPGLHLSHPITSLL